MRFKEFLDISTRNKHPVELLVGVASGFFSNSSSYDEVIHKSNDILVKKQEEVWVSYKRLSQYETSIIESFIYFDDVLNSFQNLGVLNSGRIAALVATNTNNDDNENRVEIEVSCSEDSLVATEYVSVASVAVAGGGLGLFGSSRRDNQIEKFISELKDRVTQLDTIQTCIEEYRKLLESIIFIYEMELTEVTNFVYRTPDWSQLTKLEQARIINIADIVILLKDICSKHFLVKVDSGTNNIYPYTYNSTKADKLLALAHALVVCRIGENAQLDKLRTIINF